MKKFFILFFAILLSSLSLQAQQPLVKFYMDDSEYKAYNINDIDSINLIKSNSFYVMKIFYRATLVAYYPTEVISKIQFEKDSTDNMLLNVYVYGYPKSYLLSEVDSIYFYIDIYQPLTIGTQVWMLKNLNVDHYINEDSIPEVRDRNQWSKLTTGGWCYNNNDARNGSIYGKLYNWFTINDQRELAPVGWHVPSDTELKELEIRLGMTQADANKTEWRGTDQGGQLKEAGTTHWQSPNTSATNSSGFSALPGGWRSSDGSFYDIGHTGDWWSSTEITATYTWYRYMACHNAKVRRDYYDKVSGFSVRCIKNNSK